MTTKTVKEIPNHALEMMLKTFEDEGYVSQATYDLFFVPALNPEDKEFENKRQNIINKKPLREIDIIRDELFIRGII